MPEGLVVVQGYQERVILVVILTDAMCYTRLLLMRFLRILLFDTTSGLQLVQLRLEVLNLLKHSPLLPLMCVLSVLHEVQYLIHSAAQLTQHLGVLAIYLHSGPFD